jgi:hypothetical protein
MDMYVYLLAIWLGVGTNEASVFVDAGKSS